MKKRKRTYFLALLLAMLLLTGCSAEQTAQDAPAETDDAAVYLERIGELEALLQKQREEKFISDAAYDAQIKALQSRLDAVTSGEDASDGAAGSENGEWVFHYRLEGGKAIVTDYTGSSNLVTVPATLDGYSVVAIGERAFEGKQVAAVVLPQGLEAVGWFAFYGCEGLIDVTIPASVTSIGYAAFDGCTHVSIVCEADTFAARYAASYGIPCVSP